MAVTCLSEKALLWWRGKSTILTSSGISFSDFLDELDAEFCDPDHDLRVRRRLHSLKQTGSVNAYIAAFRNLQMELGRNALTDGEAWFTFCEGLKPAVRH